MNSNMQGGLAPFASMASEIQNQAGIGTYTPTMTAVGSGGGFTISTALKITLGSGPAKPFFRWWRWQDGVAGGDLPDSQGQNGKCLAATSTAGVMQFIACSGGGGGVTSIQPQNNGTNYGSAQTGAIVMNFANCTVSSTFTITCPGSGTQTIASGAQAMGTPTVTSGTCSSAITATATGTLTTDVIIATPAVDPSGVSGYAPSATGGLYIYAWPTADAVNFKLCNNTASGITPAALTMNWKVVR